MNSANASTAAAAATLKGMLLCIGARGRPAFASTTTIATTTARSSRSSSGRQGFCTSSRRHFVPIRTSASIATGGGARSHRQATASSTASAATVAVVGAAAAAGYCVYQSSTRTPEAAAEGGRGLGVGVVVSGMVGLVGGGSACLCKGKADRSPQDSLQEYARRLQKLRSLRDIFDEYATVSCSDGAGKRMTGGDFLRAMLCYRYVQVESRELKRRCARYVNPLLGDVHGLISFDEFCFLMSLISIPAVLVDVAFAAADSDGSGLIDQEELERLVNRLAANVAEDNAGDGTREALQLAGHKRLVAAWFGEDGKGTVPRENFTAFVRDLRLDIKTVECRLYSRIVRTDEHDDGIQTATSKKSWLRWLWPRSEPTRPKGTLGNDAGKSTTGPSTTGGEGEGEGGGWPGRGWWHRYEAETISVADLALTLVSTCHPRKLPVQLARVQALKKKRSQVPLRDALLLHEILEDHAQDLEDALALYCKASPGAAVGPADFARAAKVVSGQDLSSECIWVVFKMFDEGRDGRLQYEELLSATRDRVRRLPGQRESRDSLSQFMHCVRGD